VVGTVANLVGFVLMITPLREVLDMTKDGPQKEAKNDLAPNIDTPARKEVNHMVYVSLLGNYAIWSLFGFLIKDYFIALPNALGSVLAVFYIYRLSEYRIFTIDQRQTVITFAVGVAIAAVGLFLLVRNTMLTTATVGFLASALSISFYASPLATIKTVYETKSSASLSLPLSTVIAVVTCLWTLYGYLTDNSFVIVPNGLGFTLGLIQLSLIYCYPANGARQSPTETSV